MAVRPNAAAAAREHSCCELAFLTCQTPTMALAIKMSRMTNGSTKAVIESSSSSKKANT